MEDIIVIGGGLMGSAAGWQLSKYGQNVLLIEQQTPNYKTGSSYGISRISRSLGPKDDIFSYIQKTSIAETEQLISFLNSANNNETHRMEDIYKTTPVSYMFNQEGVAELNALCHSTQKDAYKVASSNSANTVFDMTLPEANTVLREYVDYSGMINPKELIAKLQKGIKQHDNKILFGHKIISISRKETYYELKTLDHITQESKLFLTKKLVVAAGPYIGEALIEIAPKFTALISPKRVSSVFFKIKAPVYKSLTQKEKEQINLSLPTFFQYDDMFYAMIDRIDEDGSPIIKTGGHAVYHSIENMDESWKILPSNKFISWNKEEICQYLKMLNIPIKITDIEYVHGQSCVYSLTKSKIPIVTSVKGETDNSFIVMGGMNGIGAKGSLCYGLIAANILLDKKDDSPMYIKTKEALSIN